MFWLVADTAEAEDVEEDTSAAGAATGVLATACGTFPAH